MGIEPSPEITVLGPEDADAYRLLRHAAAQDPSFAFSSPAEAKWTNAQLSRLLEPTETGCILAAFLGPDPVGMVGYGRGDDPLAITLHGLFVVPGARRRGVGRVLVRAVIDADRWHNDVGRTIKLRVATHNLPAIALYESTGFRPGPATANEFEMTLQLPAP